MSDELDTNLAEEELDDNDGDAPIADDVLDEVSEPKPEDIDGEDLELNSLDRVDEDLDTDKLDEELGGLEEDDAKDVDFDSFDDIDEM